MKWLWCRLRGHDWDWDLHGKWHLWKGGNYILLCCRCGKVQLCEMCVLFARGLANGTSGQTRLRAATVKERRE